MISRRIRHNPLHGWLSPPQSVVYDNVNVGPSPITFITQTFRFFWKRKHKLAQSTFRLNSMPVRAQMRRGNWSTSFEKKTEIFARLRRWKPFNLCTLTRCSACADRQDVVGFNSPIPVVFWHWKSQVQEKYIIGEAWNYTLNNAERCAGHICYHSVQPKFDSLLHSVFHNFSQLHISQF